jgi:hypothetical protein
VVEWYRPAGTLKTEQLMNAVERLIFDSPVVIPAS